MPWYTITTAAGHALSAENGTPYLFPSAQEARRWMMHSDRGIEKWRGHFKPLPKIVTAEDDAGDA